MDLRKRLARLDRSHRDFSAASAIPERRADEFCLEAVDTPQGLLWRRRCVAELPPPDLPDMAGFLPRHETAAATAADLFFLQKDP